MNHISLRIIIAQIADILLINTFLKLEKMFYNLELKMAKLIIEH